MYNKFIFFSPLFCIYFFQPANGNWLLLNATPISDEVVRRRKKKICCSGDLFGLSPMALFLRVWTVTNTFSSFVFVCWKSYWPFGQQLPNMSKDVIRVEEKREESLSYIFLTLLHWKDAWSFYKQLIAVHSTTVATGCLDFG